MLTAYQNKYNIDLKSFHFTNSDQSENLESDLKILNGNKIVFDDGISKSFKVVNEGGLIFLKGENSVYPCLRIVHSVYNIIWTPAVVIPNGKEIKCTSNIKKSAVVVFPTPEISLLNQVDLKQFDVFLSDFIESFKSCDWFDRSRIRFIVTSYDKINSKEKLHKLKDRHLLTPLELSLGAIVFNYSLKTEDIISAINLEKEVRPDLPYLKFLNKKLSIARSTSEIISSCEFIEFIDTLNQKEIESFFEISFLKDSLNMKNLYDTFIDDTLGINIHSRLYNFNEVNISKTLYSRIVKVNLTENIVSEFHFRLQSNLRAIENIIRTNKGFDIVGSLYKETLLYQKLVELYPNYKIIRQYSPQWLLNQRFDFYFADLKIAIEYNGRQHYEPIDFFGGVGGLIENQNRDERKRKACFINNCILIEIKFDEDFELALKRIKILIDSCSK